MVEPNSSQNRADRDKYEKALASKGTGVFVLHLYVADLDFKSVQAIKNIKEICEENIPGQYKLDIIDILKQPAFARENQIIGVPTLIKETPIPLKRLVGSMSDKARVLAGLGMHSIPL